MDATSQPAPGDRLAERLKDRLARPSHEPLWTRLRDGIAEAIAEGAVRPGTRLPGERLLAAELGLSRVTLRRAIEALSADGLLLRHQGAQTVVAHRLEKAVSRLVGFSEDMRARGREPGAVLIGREAGAPSAAEAEALRLEREGRVVRIARVRLADGEAVAIERAVLPQAVLPDPESVGDSLYAALDRLGARPVRGTQRLRAVAAGPQDARHLGCAPGAPLLSIERLCVAADGRPVEFTETRYLGSAYDFLTDLVP